MEPIKIEVTLKADQTLIDLLVYLGQCVAGVRPQSHAEEPHDAPKVEAEGEINGTPVVHDEPAPDHPGVTEDDTNPFTGLDEDNSVDPGFLSDDTPNVEYTAEDARKAVNEARKRGVDTRACQDILKAMGYSSLPGLPKDKLKEFIEKVNAL